MPPYVPALERQICHLKISRYVRSPIKLLLLQNIINMGLSFRNACDLLAEIMLTWSQANKNKVTFVNR